MNSPVRHLRPPMESHPPHRPATPRQSVHATPRVAADQATYIRVDGRIYKLMPRALRSYVEEYGFDETTPFELEQCLTHIATELEEALQNHAKPIGRRGRMFRYDSSSLTFKLIGSKIVGIRISLKYNPRHDWVSADRLVSSPT